MPPKPTHHTIYPHGDGSFHTIDDQGSRVDHESFGHAVMHMAKYHGPPGDHMHIHGTEEGYTTHHVMEDGPVEGPDEHKSLGALKRHVDNCMDGE